MDDTKKYESINMILHAGMLKAMNEVQDIQTHRFVKSKNWWDDEMEGIKTKRSKWYARAKEMESKFPSREDYLNSGNIIAETKHQYYKKLFKLKQKEKIYYLENCRLETINKYGMESDKIKFREWQT